MAKNKKQIKKPKKQDLKIDFADELIAGRGYNAFRSSYRCKKSR